MCRLIIWSGLLGSRKILLRLRVILAAKGDDSHASQGTSVVGIAGEHLLKQRRGLRVMLNLKLKLPQFIEGLGLERLQLNGPLELGFGIRASLLCLQDSPQAEVRGGVFGTPGEICTQIGLCRSHMQLCHLNTGQCIEYLRILGVQLSSCLEGIGRLRQHSHLHGLDTNIQ